MTSFKPCSLLCPAVTGQPHGSLQFCPRQEPERHRAGGKFAPSFRPVREPWPDPKPPRVHGLARPLPPRKLGPDGRVLWEAFDWRTDSYVPVKMIDGDWPHFVDLPPLHPDYSDCCVDFGCCADLVEELGLGEVAAALTAAVAGDGPPTVCVRELDDGALAVDHDEEV